MEEHVLVGEARVLDGGGGFDRRFKKFEACTPLVEELLTVGKDKVGKLDVVLGERCFPQL